MTLRTCDITFIRGYGKKVIRLIGENKNTVTQISGELKKPTTTVWGYVTRLKDFSLVKEMDDKERQEAMKAKNLLDLGRNSKPLKLTSKGQLFLKLFEEKSGEISNSRIIEIIEEPKRSEDELTTEKVKVLINSILDRNENNRDVGDPLRNLFKLLYESNKIGLFAWATDYDVEPAILLMIERIKGKSRTELIVRCIGLWAAARKNRKSIIYKDDEIFLKISELSKKKNDIGRESLLVLTEFRGCNDRFAKDVLNAIVSSIWKSYGRKKPDAIANAEADFDVLKMIYQYLTPDQKKRVQLLDKIMDSDSLDHFLAAFNSDDPYDQKRKVNKERLRRLGLTLSKLEAN